MAEILLTLAKLNAKKKWAVFMRHRVVSFISFYSFPVSGQNTTAKSHSVVLDNIGKLVAGITS